LPPQQPQQPDDQQQVQQPWQQRRPPELPEQYVRRSPFDRVPRLPQRPVDVASLGSHNTLGVPKVKARLTRAFGRIITDGRPGYGVVYIERPGAGSTSGSPLVVWGETTPERYGDPEHWADRANAFDRDRFLGRTSPGMKQYYKRVRRYRRPQGGLSYSVDRGHLLAQSQRPVRLDEDGQPFPGDLEENEATFLLGANIHPQFHNLNAGVYRQHEKFAEGMLQAGWKINFYYGVLLEGHLDKLNPNPAGLVIPSHSYRFDIYSDPTLDLRKATSADLRAGRIRVSAFLAEDIGGYSGDEHMAEEMLVSPGEIMDRAPVELCGDLRPDLRAAIHDLQPSIVRARNGYVVDGQLIPYQIPTEHRFETEENKKRVWVQPLRIAPPPSRSTRSTTSASPNTMSANPP
jgi:hypothetical protein